MRFLMSYLAAVGSLTFEKPDDTRFPSIRLAREALRSGGLAPTVLNAANEIAVAAFLRREIGFLDIARIVEETLARATPPRLGDLDDVIAADTEARRLAGGYTAACRVSA